MDPRTLQTWLPLLIIAVVFALRFRGLKKATPLRAGQLFIAPMLLTAVFTLLVVSLPPSATGWLVIAFGIVIGGLVGWKRGHLMHLERNPDGAIMMRQSPAALAFILVVIFARRALAAGLGITPGADASGHMSSAAVLLTDGMLGFALGMVVVMRWTLWQRAKAVPPHSPAMEI